MSVKTRAATLATMVAGALALGSYVAVLLESRAASFVESRPYIAVQSLGSDAMALSHAYPNVNDGSITLEGRSRATWSLSSDALADDGRPSAIVIAADALTLALPSSTATISLEYVPVATFGPLRNATNRLPRYVGPLQDVELPPQVQPGFAFTLDRHRRCGPSCRVTISLSGATWHIYRVAIERRDPVRRISEFP